MPCQRMGYFYGVVVAGERLAPVPPILLTVTTIDLQIHMDMYYNVVIHQITKSYFIEEAALVAVQ